jgi:hypothetical protein
LDYAKIDEPRKQLNASISDRNELDLQIRCCGGWKESKEGFQGQFEHEIDASKVSDANKILSSLARFSAGDLLF